MKQPDIPKKIVIILLAAAALAVLVYFLADSYAFGVDDSYIFFRYAQNLAAGDGFVFNAGESPGEGFTSWIWLLLLALSNWIGINIITASKVLGLLFHLSGGWMLYLTVRKTVAGDWPAKLSALLLTGFFLVNYRLLAHSVSGMETSLYILVVLVIIHMTTRAVSAPPDDNRWWLPISIATAVVFTVRPEGIALGGLSLLALAFRQRNHLLRPAPWLHGSLGLALPVILFIIMKVIVFGYPLPHSFYHKIIVAGSEYGESLRQMLLFIKSYWWLMMAAAAVTAYTIIKKKPVKEKSGSFPFSYYAFLFTVMVLLYLLFYPAMNYLHRFYMPYFPLLLLMTAPAVHLAAEKVYSLKSGVLQVVLILILFLAPLLALNTGISSARFRVKSWGIMVNPKVNRAKLGVLMSKLPQDTVVANTEMGVIPYFSGLTCLDMAGLTDPHTAHHGISMEYLEKRRTELILFPRDVTDMTERDWKKYTQPYGSVFLSETFRENFRFIGYHSRYYVYADKRSPRYGAFTEWAGTNLEPAPPKKKSRKKQ